MDLFDDLAAQAAAAYGAAQNVAVDLVEGVNPLVAMPESRILFEGEHAVRDSDDLRRIEALPRRAATVDPASKEWLASVVEYMTARLRRVRTTPCECATLGATKKDGSPDCITRLLPIQAAYLYEAMQYGGALGSIGVGHGKTGIDILLPMVVPNCHVAVLLLPPRLVPQFKHDFRLWSQHFEVPNLAGCGDIVPFKADGRPVLELLPYSRLSTKAAAMRLHELRPDVLIYDESHNIKRPKKNSKPSARWNRVDSYRRATPKTRHFLHSGTVTTKEIQDFAPHAELALGDRSPLPLDEDTLEEWGTAINPAEEDCDTAPMGALRRLCRDGETARQGFRRRLVETPGVIATEESALGTSLFFLEREVVAPAVIRELMARVWATDERPDGDPLPDGLRKAACLRELAAGFYYRWEFPRGETRTQIDTWLAWRKAYFKELRERLIYHPADGADSDLLCWNAAERWHDGYVWLDEKGGRHVEPPFSKRGPYPVWASEHFPGWRAVKDTVQPVTVPQWVDDFLAADAVKWAQVEKGIVWYEHDAFGRRLMELGPEIPFYGGGPKANPELTENGKRSIICSIDAHGDGKKLQKFYQSLMANFPKKKSLEQVIGRTHRIGQHHDEVFVYWYRHTEEYERFFDKAYERARYVKETQGNAQKLLIGSKEWEK